MPPSASSDEAARLAALVESHILDSAPEAIFDDLTRMASSLMGTPIALVSLIDAERQWFKSRVGLDAAETPRAVAFCDHAIRTPEQIFEVPDAREDARFADNPLVQGDPNIRFYAGAPILSREGFGLGTLCIIDDKPRRLSEADRQTLAALARTASALIAARRQQHALVAAQKRLELISRATNDAIWDWTFADQRIEWNEGFETIFGWSREAVGSSEEVWLERIHPDDRARVSSAIRRVINEPALGDHWSDEYRFQHRDGRYLHVTDRGIVVRDDQGKAIRMLGGMQDISKRKQAEARIDESEGRFIRMAQDAPLKMWVTDSEGRCTFINKRWCDYVGQPESSQRGSGRAEAIHPDEREGAVNAFQAASRNRAPYTKDYRLRRHDGVYRWHRDVATARFDGDGSFLGYIGSVVDIHDEIAAAERLERLVEQRSAELIESELRYRVLAEISPSQVWTATPDGSIDYVNRTTETYVGQPSDQITGPQWTAFLHPDDVDSTLQRWQQSLVSGAELDLDYRLRRHDGVYRWHKVRARPVQATDGTITQWVGGNYDVEDIRRAEQAAAETARLKSEFLANMSHEIRTPMNGVIGMTHLLAETPLTGVQREYLDTIRNSGEHLLAVINDVLDFSKADADKLDLEHYSFSLRGCLEEALDLVAQQAAKKGLELILDASPDLPMRVSGDAGRLRQVLVNLLSNAIKFTERGEVVVVAKVLPDSTTDDRWRLQVAVRDTGIGIPEDRMGRLFQMFSQVDASHTRTHGGTGLGLAICRKLVERMNGRIWAESQWGEGSTFLFDIELGRVTHPDSPSRESHPLRGRHALIVDDNETNLRVLHDLLASWGMAVTQCSEPLTAIRMVTERRFDVALIDFMMPEMTGHQLATVLSGLDHGRALPLILLGSVSEAEHAGRVSLFRARLLKPIRHSTLYDQLALLFDLRGEDDAVPRHDSLPQPTIGASLRVLVAEDNVVNQKVAQRFLERLGHRVDIAHDGLEALNAALRQPYDVILMDVQMPVMDGFEATQAIRKALDPGPRIIAVTANALAGDEQRCRDAGMDDYLSKPLNPHALATALDRTQIALTRHRVAATDSAAVTASDRDFRQEGLEKLIALFEQDGAEELIAALDHDLKGQGQDFDGALEHNDAVVLGRVAHTLKSTSRLVGADALGTLCERVELQCREGDLGPARAEAKEMIRRYRDLVQHLKGAILPS